MSTRLLGCSSSLEGGGSERQIWLLLRALNRQLFAPDLYLLRREGVYLEQLPDDVRVFDFWSQNASAPGLGRIHRAQVNHLAQVVNREKVQLVYDRTYHMTLITAAACRKANDLARVSTIVSPPSQDFGLANERFAWLKKWLLANAYRRSTNCEHIKTLAVSQSVAEDAARFFRLALDSIEVIPSPVDIQGIRTSADSLDVRSSKHRFVVVGRQSAEKGQQQALHSLARLLQSQPELADGVQLDLIGDGPDREVLEKLTADLGLGQHVTFHGHLSNPYPYMKNATVLVPSYYEGLPNVALEAMALGSRLIATRCSDSVIELLGQNERGALVEVEATDQLASVMGTCLDDSQSGIWRDRQRLAEAYVANHHSLPIWVESMQQVFQAAVQARSGKGR